MKSGDVLTLADGTTCAIDKVYVEYSEKAITVYNFEVADFHSYYVTNTGILVHNANYTSKYKVSENNNEQINGRKGALRDAKRDARIPYNEQPFDIKNTPMTTAESAGGHIIIDKNGKPIMTREYYYKNIDGKIIIIQDHSSGHEIGGQGSHFNVRPSTNTRTGKVLGTKKHYFFKK